MKRAGNGFPRTASLHNLIPVSGVPHLYLFLLVLWMAVLVFASIVMI